MHATAAVVPSLALLSSIVCNLGSATACPRAYALVLRTNNGVSKHHGVFQQLLVFLSLFGQGVGRLAYGWGGWHTGGGGGCSSFHRSLAIMFHTAAVCESLSTVCNNGNSMVLFEFSVQ